MWRAKKTPARWQAQPGQAGSVLLSQDTPWSNGSFWIQLAQLQAIGLFPEGAAMLAAFVLGVGHG